MSNRYEFDSLDDTGDIDVLDHIDNTDLTEKKTRQKSHENSSKTDFESEYKVRDEDIASKKGNYIFTVGNVSSGKSTIQNLIVHRLWKRSDMALEFKNDKGDHRPTAILNNWVKNIDSGTLPDRTFQGKLQEYTLAFSQSKKRELEISFLEISGEDIKTIIPSPDFDTKPALNRQLDTYLKIDKKNIRKVFIFVSDVSRNRLNKKSREDIDEDILFDSLLKYLLGGRGKGLGMAKVEVLFVASKWDLVEGEYKNARHYFEKNFQGTLAITKSDRCNASFLPFSAGTINDVEIQNLDGTKTYEQQITRLEKKSSEMLIQWIYQSFTNNTLDGFPKIKKTWLDRIRMMF